MRIAERRTHKMMTLTREGQEKGNPLAAGLLSKGESEEIRRFRGVNLSQRPCDCTRNSSR